MSVRRTKRKKTSIKRKRKPKKYQKTKIKFVSIVSLLSFAASLFHTKNKKKRQTHTYHVKRFVRSQWPRTKHTKSPPTNTHTPTHTSVSFCSLQCPSHPTQTPLFRTLSLSRSNGVTNMCASALNSVRRARLGCLLLLQRAGSGFSCWGVQAKNKTVESVANEKTTC